MPKEAEEIEINDVANKKRIKKALANLTLANFTDLTSYCCLCGQRVVLGLSYCKEECPANALRGML